MKIERPKVLNAPESTTQETATAPAQLEKPLPKTDSVEMKPASFYNFDNAPKLDPSQSPNAKEVPAALIPGIPFREKAELPKTLPDGTSVDSGVGCGDLGFGKTRPGPNHMGIDLKGNDIRNQLNDALNLNEGAGVQSSAPPAGTVNLTGLAGKPGTSTGVSGMVSPNKPQSTYDAGFNRPGMGLISAEKTPQNPLGLDDYEDRRKYDTSGASDVGKWVYDNTIGRLTGKKWDDPAGIDPKKLTNPDAPEGTQPPVVTDETLEKIELRRDSTTQPGVEEHLQDIDGSQLSETDPRRALISNPNSEDQSSVTGTAGHVILDAKGPDTVNPNDPQLGGGGEPIVLDPKRPRP